MDTERFTAQTLFDPNTLSIGDLVTFEFQRPQTWFEPGEWLRIKTDSYDSHYEIKSARWNGKAVEVTAAVTQLTSKPSRPN